MRRIMIAALAAGAGACSLLFPVDEFGPAASTPDDAGLEGSAPSTGADAGIEAGTSYPDEVLADAPVLYLRFGEKTGSIARDHGRHGDAAYGARVTLGATGALEGDPDTAATFDGTADSQVTIPPGLDFAGTAPFSVEVWALQVGAGEHAWAIDHQVYGQGIRNGWALDLASDHVAFERWSGGDISAVNTTFPLVRGKYQHIVGTFDGLAAILYIDGAAMAQGESTRVMQPMTAPWTAGAQNCDGCATSNFIGSLDELAVYDKALPAARVAAHFKAGRR